VLARAQTATRAPSGAFLCQNLWDHYAFTQDRDHLANEIWPILTGAAGLLARAG